MTYICLHFQDSNYSRARVQLTLQDNSPMITNVMITNVIHVLPSYPRFTLSSAFYSHIHVLLSYPRFTLISVFYPLVRPSVRTSVRTSVRPSVRIRVLPLPFSVLTAFKPTIIHFIVGTAFKFPNHSPPPPLFSVVAQ